MKPKFLDFWRNFLKKTKERNQQFKASIKNIRETTSLDMILLSLILGPLLLVAYILSLSLLTRSSILYILSEEYILFANLAGVAMALFLISTIKAATYEPGKRKLIMLFGVPIKEICKTIGATNPDTGETQFSLSSTTSKLLVYLIAFPFSFWSEKRTWEVFANKRTVSTTVYLTESEADAPQGDNVVLATGNDTWNFLLDKEVRGFLFPTITNDGGALTLRVVIEYEILSLKKLVESGIRKWDTDHGERVTRDLLKAWSTTHNLGEVMAASNQTGARIMLKKPGSDEEEDIKTMLNKIFAAYAFSIGSINFHSPKLSEQSQDRIDMKEEEIIEASLTKIADEEAKQIEKIGAAEANALEKNLAVITKFRKENSMIVSLEATKIAESYGKLNGTLINFGNQNNGSSANEVIADTIGPLIANVMTNPKKSDFFDKKKTGNFKGKNKRKGNQKPGGN